MGPEKARNCNEVGEAAVRSPEGVPWNTNERLPNQDGMQEG